MQSLPILSAARLPRIAFLGVGWIGTRRLEALAAAHEAEIIGIADPNPESLTRAATIVPQAKRLRALEDLLRLRPDGIVISTPSAAHVEQSIICLESGIPVFCQKPLGRNAAEVTRLLQCAQAADRLLEVDLCYRHLPGLQRAKTCIEAGEIGEVFAADLVFHNAYGPDKPWFYDPELSGGGCLLDLGIHLIDAAVWTIGDIPIRARGRAIAGGKAFVPGTGVEDYATGEIDFRGGAVARLACSWRLHAGQDAVIEFNFHGTDGGLAIRNVNGSFVEFSAERFDGTHRSLLAGDNADWQRGALLEWCRRLRVSAGFDPAIAVQRDVAGLIDAIYRSERQTVPISCPGLDSFSSAGPMPDDAPLPGSAHHQEA